MDIQMNKPSLPTFGNYQVIEEVKESPTIYLANNVNENTKYQLKVVPIPK